MLTPLSQNRLSNLFSLCEENFVNGVAGEGIVLKGQIGKTMCIKSQLTFLKLGGHFFGIVNVEIHKQCEYENQ